MANSFWTTGYTISELEDAQAEFDLRFPADLIDLLLDRRPAKAPDWRTDHEQIERALKWPLEGIIFDIEEDEFWLDEWGIRPQDKGERYDIAERAVAAAPKLIPLFSHRYLPQDPAERGNPVFSVYQTDIIYYGSDLADYFANEQSDWSGKGWKDYKAIPFWSDLVLLNSAPIRES